MNGTCEFIIVGSGTSSGIPLVKCLSKKPQSCYTCMEAIKEKSNKNTRGNTCGLVRYYPNGTSSKSVNILIDCGKYFYNSALRVFPQLNIDHIDAVILTHDHADAILGLDCLRDFSSIELRSDQSEFDDSGTREGSICVYTTEREYNACLRIFPYIVSPNLGSGGGGLVSNLSFIKFDPTLPLCIKGVTFIPLQVKHGANYWSLGYRIGDLAYISDASEVPSTTMHLMNGVQTLVLDALWRGRPHSTHFHLETSISTSLEIMKIINSPRLNLYFTGMNHEIEHETTNRELECAHREYCTTGVITNPELRDAWQSERGFHSTPQLAYDGMILKVSLES